MEDDATIRMRRKTMISTQVKPALDTKGNLVGPDAVNPKYGTPKCEFHCQLAKLPGGGWVGAHPSLGSALQWLYCSGRPCWATCGPETELRRRSVAR